MKNIIKKITIIGLLFTLIVSFIAFTPPSEKFFEISKYLEIFGSLFKEVNQYYVDDIKPAKLMNVAIVAMLRSLDPYTNFIPEDEIENYRTMTTGQYGGIGTIIGKRNGKTIILLPYEGFPAHKSGLKVGDEILKIDQKDLSKKSSGDISKLLKGQAGTTLTLTVKRYGVENEFDVKMVREKIKVKNVPYYGMINNEVGYIHLTDFTTNASKEVKKSLNNLKEQGAKKIIFDLRGNPGGLLHEAVNVSNIFIPKGMEVVSTKGKVSNWNKKYTTLSPAVDIKIPLIILAGRRSASASEIVAGVVQDYDRGVIIGQSTFGKGLVQATRPLPYKSQIKITTAKYYIPSGRCIQAIDYKNRNDDGSVDRIPDSLKFVFYTKNSRVVYGGGGITPDITVDNKPLALFTLNLLKKNLLFDYAIVYHSIHESILPAKLFKLSDSEYELFINWLSDKEYDYETKVERLLQQLVTHANKEKYNDDIIDQIESLKIKVKHNKKNDLQKFKEEIIELLEEEIVKMYYLQKGVAEASFDNDLYIQTALELFNDPQRYDKILMGMKE